MFLFGSAKVLCDIDVLNIEGGAGIADIRIRLINSEHIPNTKILSEK